MAFEFKFGRQLHQKRRLASARNARDNRRFIRANVLNHVAETGDPVECLREHIAPTGRGTLEEVPDWAAWNCTRCRHRLVWEQTRSVGGRSVTRYQICRVRQVM